MIDVRVWGDYGGIHMSNKIIFNYFNWYKILLIPNL